MWGFGNEIVATINKDFSDLSDCWNSYGKSKPYWSVITQPEYLNPNTENIESFYESGSWEANYVKAMCEKYLSTPLKGKTIIDFGCGLGRITKPLLELGLKVVGMDISKAHLDLANEQVKGDVKWVHITDFSKSIQSLVGNKVDLIVTFIVLQHNRPTLMKTYVKSLLDALNTDGIAILHIPYEIPGYISDGFTGHEQMEMHCVPVKEIEKITRSGGCKMLEIDYSNDKCGGNIKNCIYVIQKK
jgi:2-polyprenyl-3-methyl-5-hydroxy-6-metoxy-1,4-benzoquinol methylase